MGSPSFNTFAQRSACARIRLGALEVAIQSDGRASAARLKSNPELKIRLSDHGWSPLPALYSSSRKTQAWRLRLRVRSASPRRGEGTGAFLSLDVSADLARFYFNSNNLRTGRGHGNCATIFGTDFGAACDWRSRLDLAEIASEIRVCRYKTRLVHSSRVRKRHRPAYARLGREWRTHACVANQKERNPEKLNSEALTSKTRRSRLCPNRKRWACCLVAP